MRKQRAGVEVPLTAGRSRIKPQRAHPLGEHQGSRDLIAMGEGVLQQPTVIEGEAAEKEIQSERSCPDFWASAQIWTEYCLEVQRELLDPAGLAE